MRTRRSPRNQNRLFKALFKVDVNGDLLKAAKAARDELRAVHSHHYPKCREGCPTHEILGQLDRAIDQAESKAARA